MKMTKRAHTMNERTTTGFTIPEYVVTIALVTVVLGGMMTCYVFGGHIYAFASTKLDCSEDMRYVMADFVHDVRTAADIDVGEGNATTFKPAAENTPREGNALQVYPSSSTNVYFRYYLDPSSRTLHVLDSTTKKIFELAAAITNSKPFTIENAWGQVITNEQATEVVGIKLMFDIAAIQSGTNRVRRSLSDYAQLSTRVTKRNAIGYQP